MCFLSIWIFTPFSPYLGISQFQPTNFVLVYQTTATTKPLYLLELHRYLDSCKAALWINLKKKIKYTAWPAKNVFSPCKIYTPSFLLVIASLWLNQQHTPCCHLTKNTLSAWSTMTKNNFKKKIIRVFSCSFAFLLLIFIAEFYFNICFA